MLPPEHRLTRSDDFRLAVRGGRRAGSHTLVLHLADAPGDPAVPPAKIGFVVSKQVGNAVVRTKVKRRLRHVVRQDLGRVPAASLLVVRAKPEAALGSFAELRSDFERCLDRVTS